MVESVADAFTEAQLSRLQTFLSKLPPLPTGLGDASSLREAHHVVEVSVLEPGEKTGPLEAAIRQDCFFRMALTKRARLAA